MLERGYFVQECKAKYALKFYMEVHVGSNRVKCEKMDCTRKNFLRLAKFRKKSVANERLRKYELSNLKKIINQNASKIAKASKIKTLQVLSNLSFSF